MSRSTPATLGISAFAPDIHGTVRLAAAADAAGFDTIWTSELFNRSATIALAAMAGVSPNAKLGSAITYGVGRSPLTLAAEARDLDELTDGRFILGLGNGTGRMIQDWHGLDPASPALRMEELVTLLRAVWNVHERPVDHQGRFYHLRFSPIEATPPVSAHLPIHTAAVNPRMIETAGRVADGLIGHPIFSKKYIDEVVKPSLAKGAEHAGRAPEDIVISSMVICSISDDEEQARNEAAKQISFYGSVKTYGFMLDRCGFGAEAEKIRAAFRDRDSEAMVRAVSDEMIDAMSVTGTAEQVREGLRRYDDTLDHTIAYSPTHLLTPERVEENLNSLITMVAGSPG